MEFWARKLQAIMQESLTSEQAKRDYAAWQARKKYGADSTTNKETTEWIELTIT